MSVHIFGTGWRSESPDDADLHPNHPWVTKLLNATGIDQVRSRLPASVDLRPWCSPVEFQGYYNTCSAHVIAGMLEFFELRATGRYVPASRLFLYQVALKLLQEEGDPGAYLRQMMGVLVMFGVPPEKYWPYLNTKVKDDPRLARPPDAFSFACARDCTALRYHRLDPQGQPPAEVLVEMKAHLAVKLPVSLGFPLYLDCLEQAATCGMFPAPTANDQKVGAHAVLLVGYDDQLKISNTSEGGTETVGAFLLKNSWKATWGDKGYGWLPYSYVLTGLAKDVWTMLSAAWVETGQFQFDLATTPDQAASGEPS